MVPMAIEISSALATLIARLQQGWGPEEPHLGTPTRAEWGALQIPGEALQFDSSNDGLQVIITATSMQQDQVFRLSSARWPLVVTFEDGSTLRAPTVFARVEP